MSKRPSALAIKRLRKFFFLLVCLSAWALNRPSWTAPLQAATPKNRVGPATPSGARWMTAGNDSFMIFVPKEWELLAAAKNSDPVLRIETTAEARALVEIRSLSIPAGSSNADAEQERLGAIKAGRAQEPLQEARNTLANGMSIRYFIYDSKILGTFLHNVNAYEFSASPSASSDWSAVKGILGTIGDIDPDAFRATPKPKPRRLIAGQWTPGELGPRQRI